MLFNLSEFYDIDLLLNNNINIDERVILIKNFIDGLKKDVIPSVKEIEYINSIANDLDVKYIELYDLLYYFDPIYIKVKKIIHKKEVENLRSKKGKRND